MNVDAHFFWDIEELLWDYFSIRNHHKIITIIRSQISQKIYIISNTSWRKNRNIVNRSKSIDWSGLEFARATNGFIRIGYNKNNLYVRDIDQILEYGGRKRWSTKKSNTHKWIIKKQGR